MKQFWDFLTSLNFPLGLSLLITLGMFITYETLKKRLLAFVEEGKK